MSVVPTADSSLYGERIRHFPDSVEMDGNREYPLAASAARRTHSRVDRRSGTTAFPFPAGASFARRLWGNWRTQAAFEGTDSMSDFKALSGIKRPTRRFPGHVPGLLNATTNLIHRCGHRRAKGTCGTGTTATRICGLLNSFKILRVLRTLRRAHDTPQKQRSLDSRFAHTFHCQPQLASSRACSDRCQLKNKKR
jgi:hypothetical protein